MFTVALIGADGAGKTTVGRHLENTLPLPVKYVYMGVNLDASNHILPTTRVIRAIKHARGDKPDAGPPDPSRVKPRPRGTARRTLAALKSGLRLLNRLGEEWFRQLLATYYQHRGHIVVFDRHFFHDYYAHDIAGHHARRSPAKRIHGFVLNHLYPKPDLVICLDAPAEVLHARKSEGTLDALERRRQEYLQIQDQVENFAIVDVSRPLDEVVQDVSKLIWQFYQRRTGRLNGQLKGAEETGSGGDRETRRRGEGEKGSKGRVLVTNAGRGSAIAFIRSLGRQGWQVIAADAEPGSPGFKSRYASGHVIYPPPETAPCDFVATLLEVAQGQGIDLIVPITDEVILPLSKARSRFEGLCELALPDPAALDVVTNKQKTFDLAARLNVPAPRSYLVHTVQEAAEKAPGLGWPVVLKPLRSRLYDEQAGVESFKVCYAEDLDHLKVQMQRFEARCPVLLQEFYAGTGLGVELLMHGGRPLAAFQHRRLHELPVTGGVSTLRESVPLDPMLYQHAVALLAALNWTGLAMVEFKVGQDGPRLMEINGRVWGSLPLAVHSGMDFPGHLAEMVLNGFPSGETAPDTAYATGVRACNLELELKWIATVLLGRRRYPFLPMPGRRQGLMALVQLLNPTYRFDILSREDPRPGLAALPQIVRKFSRKL